METRRTRWDRFEQDTGCCGDFSCLTGSSLVLTILSYLDGDLHALFRLRCVCKSWYDAVLSPQFIALRDQRMEEPWAMVKARSELPTSHISIDFGIFDHKLHYDYYDYNNSMESHVELWRPSSSSRGVPCSIPLGPPGSLLFLGLGCSSNGLVCGRLMEDRDLLSLAVGNPLTGEWERLPPAPVDNTRPPEIIALLQGYPLDRLVRPPYMVFSLHADPPPRHGGSSSYRVLAFNDSDYISLVALYDSRNGAWECIPGFNLEGASADAPASVLLEASAFSVSRFEPATVAALTIDSTTMAWHYVDESPPMVDDDTRFQQAVRIFNHGGCCILAGLITSQNEDGESSREGFGVWELELCGEEDRARWRLVSRVRAVDVFGEGCKMHDDSDVKVQLCGGLVFFSSWYKRKTHGTWPPIAYDLCNSTWHSFAERTLLPYSSDVDFECSYAFVPSLAARP